MGSTGAADHSESEQSSTRTSLHPESPLRSEPRWDLLFSATGSVDGFERSCARWTATAPSSRADTSSSCHLRQLHHLLMIFSATSPTHYGAGDDASGCACEQCGVEAAACRHSGLPETGKRTTVSVPFCTQLFYLRVRSDRCARPGPRIGLRSSSARALQPLGWPGVRPGPTSERELND